MPHHQLEYGVLYHIERGPSREHIYDAARLGFIDCSISKIIFELRGDDRDYIGQAFARVHGAHRLPDGNMLFFWGQLPRQPEWLQEDSKKPLDEIWNKAFYFAQYNLKTHKGRILLGESSFLENPLKKFGAYQEAEDSL